MKRSTIKAMRRTSPEKTKWLAMLGARVAVPHGKEMARLAAFCARVRETQSPVTPAHSDRLRTAIQTLNRRRERWAKRRVAPRLAALLFDALATLDPQPLENFAAIVRRIREYNADGQAALPFQDKAMRLADVTRLKGEPPLTQKQFLQRLGVPPKEHDESSRERKILKMLPIDFTPAKRGRPKKGTRKPQK
jgi:hypothetical protein